MCLASQAQRASQFASFVDPWYRFPFPDVVLYTHTNMPNVARITTLESAAAFSAAAFSAAALASASAFPFASASAFASAAAFEMHPHVSVIKSVILQ